MTSKNSTPIFILVLSLLSLSSWGAGCHGIEALCQKRSGECTNYIKDGDGQYYNCTLKDGECTTMGVPACTPENN
jgi:hypothetical protein